MTVRVVGQVTRVALCRNCEVKLEYAKEDMTKETEHVFDWYSIVCPSCGTKVRVDALEVDYEDWKSSSTR